MMRFAVTTFIVCIALMLATANNVTTSLLAPPDPKYTTVELTWAIETVPGNSTSITLLNGTVQEVQRQLIMIKPNYYDLLEERRATEAMTAQPSSFGSLRVNLQSDVPGNCGYCNVCTKRWTPAEYHTILEGINYLQNLKNKPEMGPGPRECSRVSCEFGSAIWWCNDEDERKVLDSWQQIAEAAEDITRQCFWFSRQQDLLTGGQSFHPDGWNIIVSGGNNC